MSFNKNEKMIFWLGILSGIVGGAVGNFWVGSYFNMISEDYSDLSFITFILCSLIFLFLVFWIYKILKKIQLIKRGRPKKLK